MTLNEFSGHIPVLLIIFNRLDTTQLVFERIRQVKPRKLYVAADGPRTPLEATKCQEVSDWVLNNVDWDTEVFTFIRQENLGCRLNVSGAISWFFSREEKGIILEDDCLPTISFFSFCEELLTKYENVPEVMHISGTNMQDAIFRGSNSYYFSRISHIWGWASWRRAWLQYDLELAGLDDFIKEKSINQVFDSLSPRLNFMRVLKQIKNSKNASTWDFQWTFSIMKSGGLCITPNSNMISNIGFGGESTHAWDSGSRFANRPTTELVILTHPSELKVSKAADNYEGDTIYKIPDLHYIIRKLYHQICSYLNKKR